MLNAVSRFFLLSFDFKKTAPVGKFQKALWKNLQPVILLSMLSGLFLYCAPSSHFPRSILNQAGKVKFIFRFSFFPHSFFCAKSYPYLIVLRFSSPPFLFPCRSPSTIHGSVTSWSILPHTSHSLHFSVIHRDSLPRRDTSLHRRKGGASSYFRPEAGYSFHQWFFAASQLKH